MYNGVCKILPKRNMLGKMNLFTIFERYTDTKSLKQVFAFKEDI